MVSLSQRHNRRRSNTEIESACFRYDSDDSFTSTIVHKKHKIGLFDIE